MVSKQSNGVELFNPHICARERADQLGKSDTMIGTPSDAVTMRSRMQSRQTKLPTATHFTLLLL